MNKHEFLAKLRSKLSDLPEDEIIERLNFYEEMIDDKMEEGLSEEEAVSSIGKVSEVAREILSNSYEERVLERVAVKKRVKPIEIILLVLGSPILLSIILSLIAVAVSLYAVLWSLVVSLWAVFVSFAACSLALPLAGIFFALNGHLWSGLACFSVGLVLIGLSIFVYFGSVYAVKAVVWLTKELFGRLRNLSVKREAEQ